VTTESTAIVPGKGHSRLEMDVNGQVKNKVLKVGSRVTMMPPAVTSLEQPSLPVEDDDGDDDDPPDDLEPLDISSHASDGVKPVDREPLSVGAEPMEIEQTRSEEDDDDLEALLGDSTNSTSETTVRKKKAGGCCASKRVGNVIILCQGCHSRTGFGTLGPHWFGPPCVLFIVAWASHHFVHKATLIGPISTAICVFFMLGTITNLLATSFKDPGVVIGRPAEADLSEYRWCDFCNVFQPPDGAHCPDCNVCIAGYDHHCIWMGVCIGKGNIKSFVRFNMFWILYLLYSVLWLSVVGPIMMKHATGSKL
jgi:hypothetical protein